MTPCQALWYFEPMALEKNTVLKDAQKFAAKGQYDKAIAEWKKLLKESPNDPNIYNTIGDLCLKKNSKPEAVDAYKRAADLLAEDGFTSKAIALYKKVLNIDVTRIDVHLALGDMNAEKGLTGNALENYKHAADHYIHNKETAKALDIYQKMADLNPSNVAFQIKLGDMYAKEGMKAKSAKAYLGAADVHLTKNEFKDARHLFEKVLALDPGNKEVYHKAGIVYFREGKFVEACKALKPAFENDPANAELFDIYLEALDKAGKDVEVEQVIRKLLAEKPDNAAVREKLYELYLSKKDFEKAIVEAETLANGKIESGNAGEAEELYKSFVEGSPYFAPGRQKLAEFYLSVNQPQNAATELLQAAELLVVEGDLEGAKAVLTQTIEIAPDLSEARERLEQLTGAPPPAREFTAAEKPIPAAPAPVVHEPKPSPVHKAPAPTPPAAATPVSADEDPAIAGAIAEVDVLIKYGLAAKAIEQLEAMTSKFPESPRIRARLSDLYYGQGNVDKAVRHALLAVALYTKYGREDQAMAVLQATREMAPDHPAVLARLGRVPVALEPEEPMRKAPKEFGQPEFMVDLDIPVTEPEISSPSLEETLAPRQSAPAGEIAFEGLDLELPPLEEPSIAETAPVAEPPAVEEPSFEEELSGGLEPAVISPVEEAAPHASPAEVDVGEIWAEAEFFFQQGLFDAAKKHYAQIIQLTPGDRRAIDRLSELSREEDETREFTMLTDAVDDLENHIPPKAPAADLTTSASDNEAVRTLMQEIQQLKQQPPAPSPPPAKKKIVAPPPRAAADAVSRPPEPARKAAEENFFDLGEELQREAASAVVQKEEKASEDFFDLAAELRDELSNIPAPARPAVPAEEQSLDDIFEEFKKGIEQQSEKEEADTHYNLGVAYKEMGLLDDAIGELILTHENEPKFIQSRYMLGLCYMEKGEYLNAIGEIQNALTYSETLEMNAENRVVMHYDLGLAYQGAGNINSAIEAFQKVADEDPGYRDTAAKLKELRKGDYISFEQLKDDIEKEISSKFLEEGERIEREEKTKKNDRVRS